jgi:hypothetical protein
MTNYIVEAMVGTRSRPIDAVLGNASWWTPRGPKVIMTLHLLPVNCLPQTLSHRMWDILSKPSGRPFEELSLGQKAQ